MTVKNRLLRFKKIFMEKHPIIFNNIINTVLAVMLIGGFVLIIMGFVFLLNRRYCELEDSRDDCPKNNKAILKITAKYQITDYNCDECTEYRREGIGRHTCTRRSRQICSKLFFEANSTDTSISCQFNKKMTYLNKEILENDFLNYKLENQQIVIYFGEDIEISMCISSDSSDSQFKKYRRQNGFVLGVVFLFTGVSFIVIFFLVCHYCTGSEQVSPIPNPIYLPNDNENQNQIKSQSQSQSQIQIQIQSQSQS